MFLNHREFEVFRYLSMYCITLYPKTYITATVGQEGEAVDSLATERAEQDDDNDKHFNSPTRVPETLKSTTRSWSRLKRRQADPHAPLATYIFVFPTFRDDVGIIGDEQRRKPTAAGVSWWLGEKFLIAIIVIIATNKNQTTHESQVMTTPLWYYPMRR
ncbi:hypothetical protein NHQ30_003756 [Ciborinia camelliae]|nr:hypothetical protein NHQ30_003756 [Ciborinia camelliae]